MSRFKRKRQIYSYLPLLFFFMGLILASSATPLITQGLMGLQALVTLAGLMALLGFKMYRQAILSPDTKAFPQLVSYKRLPFWKYVLALFIIQGALLVLSLILFHTLEFMTQVNPRLQPLESGRFLQVGFGPACVIHYMPWVLYGVVGVGMAYFTVQRGCPPILADMIVPQYRRHPKLFIHNYFLVVTETVRFGPFMHLMTLAILWQCQTLSGYFQLELLSRSPFRTVFICLLIFLLFRKSRNRLIDRLQIRKVPLGGMMAFFALIISFFVFWLHATGDWFSFGLENIHGQQESKSVLTDLLTRGSEGDRFSLLMWGWWGIGLPWMSSMIARVSMGRTVFEALLSALVFPTLFFILLSRMTVEEWIFMRNFLKEPETAMGIAVFLLLFMLFFFGHIHSTRDIARGGLISFGKWRGSLFSKWMSGLLTTVACYFPALMILGWVSAQIINTLGAFFITTVILGFIWTLFSSRAPLSDEAKYKVLESP